jgi:drug/metabolite transporter (DMT)-like permease
MLAIALALAASIAAGSTDFFAGLLSRRLGVVTVLVVSHVSSVGLLLVAAAIFGLSPLEPTLLGLAALSGFCVVIGAGSFWRGLTVGAMGVVAPIAAFGAVVPVVAGLASGEQLSTVQAVGITLGIIGVVLASVETHPVRADGRRIAAGVGFALLAIVGIGGFYVSIDAATEHGTPLTAVLINRITSSFILMALALATIGGIRLARPDVLPMIGVGALEMSAIFMFAAASTEGTLAVVGAVSALFPLVTVLLARLVLHERLGATQRIGSLTAVAGVAMLGAGAASA